jgi:hypothetical protein
LQFRSIQFLVFVGFLWAPPSRLAAQDHDHSQMNQAPATTDWSWATDSNVIFGYNYQQRQFADFWAWESQNWVMLSGERKAGPGRLSVNGMMSFEPWTIGRLVYAKGDNGSAQRIYAFNANRERVPLGGSPQTFQTGESYLGAPLINYQHPHDLFMEIGAKYRLDRGRLKYTFEGDLVGSPALGPVAFMHREVRAQQSASAAHPSLHRLDAHHAGCGHSRCRRGPDDVRDVGVPRPGARRKSAEHRAGRGSTPGRRVRATGRDPGRRSSPAAI